MNVLFVGNHPPKSLIESTNGRIDSFYRSSEAVVEGFRENNDIQIDVITSPDIPSYPNDKIFFPRQYSQDDNVLMVSSLNLPVIKHIWTSISLYKAAKRLLRGREEVTYVIIPYMVFRHVIALRLIAHFCHRVKTGLIIPDIFFHKGIVSKLLNIITERYARKSDFFILYTESMAEYLKIVDKPHITIEGFKKIPQRSFPISNSYKVLYAGTLDMKYGIARLVEMMSFIEESQIELHVYGDGDGATIVKEGSEKDRRIFYHGRVAKEEADAAIKNAMALINPRNQEDGDFVKYSFPSKDIDYLASGVPAILCKLPGMPLSYYGYFIDAGKGSPKELADAVKCVYAMPQEERNLFAGKAYDFISARMDIANQINNIVCLFEAV